MSDIDTPPFALFIRGPSDVIFTLSDTLGFDAEMKALAVSVFEDGPQHMHVQALFAHEAEAQACLKTLELDGLEHFITQLPDEDWTAKSQAGLPPVLAGRFFVYGSHDADKIPPDCPYPIQIDAGIAFGTGHHGTTKGCLLAFDDYIQNNTPSQILDLGCGAGVLAIAAAKALNIPVQASDIDGDAVQVTDDNAVLNQVAHLIHAFKQDGLIAVQEFDLIFANILAGPLITLAPDIAQALKPNGAVILSGLLDEQSGKVVLAYKAQGLHLTRHASLAGWTSLTMKKA
ncbi:MAG: 50S ribosomal protein L11 methyltransferase [Robiginitomaculum sp.]|nr:50S ribosomal protein L11 methyltransferase [Robiginitomaculum sp.]